MSCRLRLRAFRHSSSTIKCRTPTRYLSMIRRKVIQKGKCMKVRSARYTIFMAPLLILKVDVRYLVASNRYDVTKKMRVVLRLHFEDALQSTEQVHDISKQ